MSSEILAQVIRGETVESIHRGHIYVVDGEGNTVASVGDPSTVTYFRSAAKPFQLLPLLAAGGADNGLRATLGGWHTRNGHFQPHEDFMK